MSRRKHRRSHGNRQQPQSQKKEYSRKYIIPLSEWQQYERFKEYLPQIEESLNDLQESCNNHIGYIVDELEDTPEELEKLRDDVIRLSDIIRGVELPIRKSRRQSFYDSSVHHTDRVSNRPKGKFENMMAEIIIEDVSNGGI